MITCRAQLQGSSVYSVRLQLSSWKTWAPVTPLLRFQLALQSLWLLYSSYKSGRTFQTAED